jgi:hypothetical protein
MVLFNGDDFVKIKILWLSTNHTSQIQGVPMTKTISQDLFVSEINNHLDETFESVMGIYLDKGTSLFETLDQITAAQASRPISSRCASLAAQVKHIIFYLTVSDRYIFTTDDFQVDWSEVWRTTGKVTPAEWDALRNELKETYRHLRQRLNTVESWDAERPLGGVIALIAHTAYHLGEIRQATCILKDE